MCEQPSLHGCRGQQEGVQRLHPPFSRATAIFSTERGVMAGEETGADLEERAILAEVDEELAAQLSANHAVPLRGVAAARLHNLSSNLLVRTWRHQQS